MMGNLMGLSVRNRWAIVALFLLVAAFGFWQLLKLPIDAVPDITNKQVQINTVAPALGPTEMERQVTYPIETAMAGIPGLESTRSISRNGFSQVTVVFDESTDLYFARQQATERLTQARSDRVGSGAWGDLGGSEASNGGLGLWVWDTSGAGRCAGVAPAATDCLVKVNHMI